MQEIHVELDVLSHDLCSTIIDLFHRDERNHVPARIYNKSPEGDSSRRGVVVPTRDDDEWGVIRGQVKELAKEKVLSLGRRDSRIASLARPGSFIISNPRVECIQPGGGFEWHMDSRHSVGDRRFLTILFYLNTPSGGGGEIEFLSQNVQYSPNAGALLMFPPFWTHAHRGKSPIGGNKYTLGMFAMMDEEVSEQYTGG